MELRVQLQSKECPIFGRYRDLPRKALPTWADVILCCLLEQKSMNKVEKTNNVPKFAVAKSVSKKLHDLWMRQTIPTISTRRIIANLVICMNKYRDLKKYKKKQHQLLAWKQKLFDIAACKCKIDCCCPDYAKVPRKILKFLKDQRERRRRRLWTKPLRNGKF
jgi:hypothetical protein